MGRVEGAQGLEEEERTLLESLLLRLVRLGDTGGATRAEFDEPRWQLVQKLASPQGKRLVLLGGSSEDPTVEIAHEALVTAWPYFQNLLQKTAPEKRVLDALIPRAQAWFESDPQERHKRLATGTDLEQFVALKERHEAWLSDPEREFIAASIAAEEKRRQREHRMTRRLQGLTVFLLIALTAAVGMGWLATEARDEATAAAKAAKANESRALAALSKTAFNTHHYVDAVKLALAAWPRTAGGDRPQLRVTIDALGTAQRRQRQVIPPLRHGETVIGAAFNRAGTQILTWSNDRTARLWDISRLPPGHLIQIACEMLPDHDMSAFKERYGIEIAEPICGPGMPAPVWTELED